MGNSAGWQDKGRINADKSQATTCAGAPGLKPF